MMMMKYVTVTIFAVLYRFTQGPQCVLYKSDWHRKNKVPYFLFVGNFYFEPTFKSLMTCYLK